MTDYSIPRDQYGRPLLYPPEGGRRMGYSRCSTLAKDLDKPGDGLKQWHQANAMIGLVRNENLFRRLKAIVAKGGTWDSSKGDLKEIAKTAETIGGATNKADRGTSIHDYTEAVEQDSLDWSLVDEGMKPILDGYYEDIVSKPGVKILARETFVAINDPLVLPDGRKTALRAAGSVDRIVEIDGVRRIADIKTGGDDQYRMGVSGQLYLYQRGQFYQDPGVQQDIDWAEFWPNADWTAEFADHGCAEDFALMFHCRKTASKDGKWHWDIYEVPLSRGRDIVLGGQWARKLRSVPEFKKLVL